MALHPAVPIGLSLLTSFARGSKKKKRKHKNGANGAETATEAESPKAKTKRSRALDVLAIQSGVKAWRKDKTSENVSEEPVVTRRRGVEETPASERANRLTRTFSSDTIGVTNDGERGYVGAKWWANTGRAVLVQTRKRYPAATPAEVLNLVLAQAVPTVDWTKPDAEIPRGATMIRTRMRRLVDAAFMGRQEENEAPARRTFRMRTAEVAADAGEETQAAESVAPTSGMPFSSIAGMEAKLAETVTGSDDTEEAAQEEAPVRGSSRERAKSSGLAPAAAGPETESEPVEE